MVNDFMKAWKEPIQVVCSNPKLGTGHNFLFSGNGGLIFCQKQIFNTSSERPSSKLSENHKINIFRPTELKLWPFKKMLYLTLGRSPSF